MSPTNARRRQHSVRLLAAVAFLVVSALVVAGALLSGSFILVALAAVLAVVLGAAAARITHSELMQARRHAARDRAEQARAYKELDARRTAEHRTQAESLILRVAHRQQTIHQLEGQLAAAEDRLTSEAAKAEEAEQYAAEAVFTVAELEQELTDLKVELTDLKVELTAWEATVPARLRQHA
jgi:chromosome segregation ATPase